MLVQAKQKNCLPCGNAGTREASEATDLVPQGSGGAARASGLDIALGLQQQFKAYRWRVCYQRGLPCLAYYETVN